MNLVEIWSRNSFDVEAVRVTEENIRQVATWCEGTVAKTLTDNPKLYICLDTVHYNKHRETKAYIGDWIILVDGEYRHYRDKSFKLAYKQKSSKIDAVVALVEGAMGGNSWNRGPDGESVLAVDVSQEIVKLFEGE